MDIRLKRVLIPCTIAAVLMLGIPYAGIQYFKSPGHLVRQRGESTR
ncbi:hypothetical protein H6G00_00655 [Leptolyngbya sp. FACHB-541]|nr:hypothetical protein [Leptolyngbya sp. FACHB-541]MBD1995137.1 hypothetical protein [Leptolyngbya sp. FACHB-541]